MAAHAWLAGQSLAGCLPGLVDQQKPRWEPLIGGVAPVVVKGGNDRRKSPDRANQRLADALRDFERSAPRNQTIEEAVKAGYVIRQQPSPLGIKTGCWSRFRQAGNPATCIRQEQQGNR